MVFNNKLKIKNNSSGKAIVMILALAVAVILIVIALYLVLRWNASRKPNVSEEDVGPPKPVYDVTIGDVKFAFQSAQDLGSIIVKTDGGFTHKLTTTDRFLKVTITAQNKGKFNVEKYLWEIGNIIDSEGRNFVSIDDQAYYFLPNPNLCGTQLKPEFTPTPCVKFYEVSRASEKLKIVVSVTNRESNKKQQDLLDLNVRYYGN